MTLRSISLLLALGACGQVSNPAASDAGNPGDDATTGPLAVTLDNADPAMHFVRTGGQVSVPVAVARDGVTGPITIELVTPPSGITSDPLTLDGDSGLLVVHVAADAAFARTTLAVIATADHTTGSGSLALEVIGTAGTLDPTFGTAGTVGFAASDKADTSQLAIAQGDRVIVGIVIERAGHDGVLLVRRARDGSLDSSFGSAGEVFIDLSPIGITSSVVATAAAQADGKIVIAGSGFNGNDGDPFLVRLTADGQIDSSLALRKLDVTTANITLANVTIGPAGELVFVGRKAAGTGSDGIVIRTDRSGVRDASFGSNGIATFADKVSDDITGAVVQPDGRIVVLVSTSNNTQFESPEFSLRRFGTAGQLDVTFGGTGKALLPSPESTAAATTLVSPDRLKLVVAGTLRQTFAGGDAGVWQYLADGRLDLGFGGGIGFYAAPASTMLDGIARLVVADDGTLYGIGNEADQIAAPTRLAILHLDAAGIPDPAFGTAGVARTTTSFVTRAVALRSDHRLLVVTGPGFVDDTADTSITGFWN